MIRSWQDRLLRFGMGTAFGVLLSGGFHYAQERDFFWGMCSVALVFGLLTADLGKQ